MKGNNKQMKNTRFSKVILLILTFVMLVGSITLISVSAEGEASANEVEILAQNIVYGEKVSIAYAVNASIEDAVAGNVKLSYYWAGEPESVKNAYLLDTTDEDNLYQEKYPVFVTEGVAAKELDKVAYAAAYTGDTAPESFTYTYSAVQYLYAKLYRDNFINKTESDGKDYFRKTMYQSLLSYGAAAQNLLINYEAADADKVTLITDYSYAYTSVDGVALNGAKTALGEGELTIVATYSGANLAGWTITYSDGTVDEVEVSEFTVDGVASITPIIGSHDCADADNDHACDTCGETVSDCKNENGDHACDICGKVLTPCVDTATVDGKCDICGIYAFEYDITTGVSIKTYTNASDKEISATQTTITETSSAVSYYGAVAKLVADPKNATNKVLQIVINNSVNNTQTNQASDSIIELHASSKADGGQIHVVEYDFYVDHINGAVRNPYDIRAYSADGTMLGWLANGTSDNQWMGHSRFVTITKDGVTENVYHFATGSAQSNEDSYVLLDADKWYRIRLIWDKSSGALYYDVSVDGGETWYLLTSAARTHAIAEDVDHLALRFNHYAYGATYLFDDISYTIVDTMPTRGTELFNDSVEYPNGR